MLFPQRCNEKTSNGLIRLDAGMQQAADKCAVLPE